MCGIVGWVDFSRDLRKESAIVRAMTATMSQRGPDAEGIWLRRHVGLGHRRLSVIDLASGTQPMIAEHDGRVLAALTYSGEVYNFRELREELVAHGHHFHTSSDTEVVLHAYLEWGENFVDRLDGMFAFGLWDEQKQTLLLVRDRIGVKPLYYRPTPDGVLFASEPKGILVHPAAPAVIDSNGLREMLTFANTPGHGIFQGMHQVRPGEIVRVDASGLHQRLYWHFSAKEHEDDLDATVAKIRELLDDITAHQLVADVPLCSLLSGDLGTSALTALAAESLRGSGGGAIRSFSVDFTGRAENLTPDNAYTSSDTAFVRDMVKQVQADHTDIELDNAALLDPLYRSGSLNAYDLPTGFGDMNTSLYLLFRAVAESSTVALSGESADELFGGYWWFHDQRVVNTAMFPWMTALQPPTPTGEASSVVSLLDAGLSRKLELTGYRRQAYQDALKEVERLPGEDRTEARMREMSYLHLTRFMPLLLDRQDRMSMAHGLEVRVPFCDHRLMDYVYNTPWAMKTFDGREKSLLRAAVKDLLPTSVTDRKKSGHPLTQDPGYDPAIRAELLDMLDDSASGLVPILNTDLVRYLGETDFDGTDFSTTARRGIELVLSLDEWLRRYPVRIELD